jgi:tetratricopeptide (TPR) repeat protein
MKRATLYTIIFIISLTKVFGQKTIKAYIEEGDQFMNSGKFYAASAAYEKALSFDTLNADICYKFAKSLSNGLNYCKAIKWFEKTLANSDTTKFPLAIFQLGQAQKNCGDYQNALKTFNISLELANNIDELKEIYPLILHEISSVQFAIKHEQDSIKLYVHQLPTPINTTNSEFNPVILPGDRLVFSTYKTLYSDSFSNIFSTTYISNIYTSKLSNNGWNEPEIFDSKINSSQWFTANICFADHYKTAYFTRCNDDNGLVGRCYIYKTEKKNGKWTKPQKLPDEINIDGYSTTQPNWVEGTGFDILYFASNRPNGYGGMDIWYSIIKDGKFQTPTNLGNVINTRGNEITPYYSLENSSLYFSSDWHESFGGYDIFASKGGLSQWEEPENLGLPINSENNDLYYTPKPNSNEIYMSSNRLGSLTESGTDYCCSDIYLVTSEKIPNKFIPETLINDSIPITIENKIRLLLPITLYFDNDQPDPKSLSDTTKEDYKTLLNNYINQINNYQNHYSEGLNKKDSQAAKDSITVFFNDYVEKGFEKLQQFTYLLKQEIDSGKTINLKIIGYASPLNTSEYNYHLSKRRIQSLINYLTIADSGYFEPFLMINQPELARIKIYQDPRGDRSAAPFVSNNPNDKRNSVYSKAAALERKIQIIMYSSDYENNETSTFEINNIFIENDSIAKGELVKGFFKIINTGNSDLKINYDLQKSNNIQLQPEEMIIKPMSNEKFYFLINTSDLDIGKIQKSIIINSNTQEKREIKIIFTIY